MRLAGCVGRWNVRAAVQAVHTPSWYCVVMSWSELFFLSAVKLVCETEGVKSAALRKTWLARSKKRSSGVG